MYEEEIIYTEGEPPCKIIRSNEPNLEIMAKAIRELYYELLENGKLDKDC